MPSNALAAGVEAPNNRAEIRASTTGRRFIARGYELLGAPQILSTIN
jgi:hypothetical protein